MELFWRSKIPEKSQQDFSDTLPLHGGVPAQTEDVASLFLRWGWVGDPFGPAEVAVPAVSICCRLLFHCLPIKSWLVCCCHPSFVQRMMHRHVVYSRAETTTAVFGGWGWGGCGRGSVPPSEVPAAASDEAHLGSITGLCFQRADLSKWERRLLVIEITNCKRFREGGAILGQVQHGMLKNKWCLGSSIRQKVAEEAGGVRGK